MAAGTWQIYHEGRLRLSNATFDIDADTFVCALFDNAYTPDLAAHLDLTDIVGDEIADTDYARVTLTSVTYDETNGICTFDSADIDFGTTVDIAARYAVVFDDTHANDGLLAYLDLNDGGAANVSSSASQFLIQIAATGIFTLTQT